jgi:hypothetical protein
MQLVKLLLSLLLFFIFYYLFDWFHSKYTIKKLKSFNAEKKPVSILKKNMIKKKSKKVRFNKNIKIIPPNPLFKKMDRFNPYLKIDMVRNIELARKFGSNKMLAQYSLLQASNA